VTLGGRFGFTGGILARLALVGVYAALAGAAILLVETRPQRPAVIAPTTTAPPLELTISIESTYPVAAWSVRHAGSALVGESGATRWQGGVTVDSQERQLVVEATARDPLAVGPCALRITVRRAGAASEMSTLWGSGFISGIVNLPEPR
jgi:hypothetical protein